MKQFPSLQYTVILSSPIFEILAAGLLRLNESDPAVSDSSLKGFSLK